jgi:hypothetical protein
MDTKSTLDSLETIEEDKIKVIQARQDSTAYADSLRQAEIEQKRLEAIPTLEEKTSTIPAIKALEFMADIPGLRESAIYFNQALYDIGAHTYNLGAVPLNTLGRLFGYNPGFSGERVMGKLFGDWSGVDPKKTLSSAYYDAAKTFDPSAEYENTAWGTYAPEGGEWSWEKEEKDKKKPKRKTISGTLKSSSSSADTSGTDKSERFIHWPWLD